MNQISVNALQAAKMLGISLSSLAKLTARGELRPYKLFGDKGSRYYWVRELEDFVKRRIDDANQAAISTIDQSLLPSVAQPSGHLCCRSAIQARRCRSDRGAAKATGPAATGDDGVSSRQETERHGQRAQSDSRRSPARRFIRRRQSD